MNGDSASPRVCERAGSIAVAKPSVTSIIMQGRSGIPAIFGGTLLLKHLTPEMRDVVIAGENRDYIAVLGIPSTAEIVDDNVVQARVRAKLMALAAEASGSARRARGIEHHDIIEAFAADRADQPFFLCVLPG